MSNQGKFGNGPARFDVEHRVRETTPKANPRGPRFTARHAWIEFARLLTLGMVIATWAGGCCATGTVERRGPVRQSNIVFNPESSMLAARDAPRADWPVAYLEYTTREETSYRERIVDIQSRPFGFGEDYLYRRFDSSRKGVGRR